MKLIKMRILFLSPFFFPTTYEYERFSIVHDHIPPSTLSGMLFRLVLYWMKGIEGVKGDWKLHRVDEGLVVSLRRHSNNIAVEWSIVGSVAEGKAKPKPNFYPPYLEFHFNAVALGAYSPEVFMGRKPRLGEIEKYWNVIKYVDPRSPHLPMAVELGLKTWHFTIMDGTAVRLKPSEKQGRRIMVYEVVKVKHLVPLKEFFGFVLSDDHVISSVFEDLRKEGGWYLAKTRGKTLLALIVEDIMDEVSLESYNVGEEIKADSLRILPSPSYIPKPTYVFTSALLDLDVLKKGKRGRSVRKGLLYATDRIKDNGKFLTFKGTTKEEWYLVPSSWGNWL